MFRFLKRKRSYDTAEAKLKLATSIVGPILGEAGYPDRVQFVYECIEYNEAAVALETLCENLYEFSCPVPQRALELIKEAGELLGIESKVWEQLGPLVTRP